MSPTIQILGEISKQQRRAARTPIERKTPASPLPCSSALLLEIGNTNTESFIDHNDLARPEKRAPREDIDVLASGTGQLDHRSAPPGENRTHRHRFVSPLKPDVEGV